jgi:hypothetical protein
MRGIDPRRLPFPEVIQEGVWRTGIRGEQEGCIEEEKPQNPWAEESSCCQETARVPCEQDQDGSLEKK